jgi:hypothetical protein
VKPSRPRTLSGGSVLITDHTSSFVKHSHSSPRLQEGKVQEAEVEGIGTGSVLTQQIVKELECCFLFDQVATIVQKGVNMLPVAPGIGMTMEEAGGAHLLH